MKTTTINKEEIDKFSKIAEEWWDPEGKFKPLHIFNPLRIKYIKDSIIKHFNIKKKKLPLSGLKILDIGCGGGLITEPMSRLGANITGIDKITYVDVTAGADTTLTIGAYTLSATAALALTIDASELDGGVAPEIFTLAGVASVTRMDITGGGAGDLPKPFSYAPRSGLVPMGAGLSFPVISYSGALRGIYVSQFEVPFPSASDVPDKEKSPLAGSVNPGSTS